MKSLPFKFVMLLISIALTMNSCKKDKDDNDNDNTTPVPTTSFSAKINNTAYSGTTNASFVNSAGIIVISLPFSVGTVAINVTAATGTYTLGGLNCCSLNMSSLTYHTSFAGGSGSVTITTLTSNEVSGNFNFTAKTYNGASTVTVTEGTFTKISS